MAEQNYDFAESRRKITEIENRRVLEKENAELRTKKATKGDIFAKTEETLAKIAAIQKELIKLEHEAKVQKAEEKPHLVETSKAGQSNEKVIAEKPKDEPHEQSADESQKAEPTRKFVCSSPTSVGAVSIIYIYDCFHSSGQLLSILSY